MKNYDQGMTVIKTEHLFLRKHNKNDAEILHAVFRDEPSMTEYTGWNPYETLEDAKCAVQRFMDEDGRNGSFSRAIEYEGKLAGTIGAYDYDDENHAIEVGYSIFPEYRGNGFAKEALRAVIENLFKQNEILCITAWCDPVHTASRHVLEGAGMKYVRTDTDSEYGDRLVYEIRKNTV